jgi:hypothetical protein
VSCCPAGASWPPASSSASFCSTIISAVSSHAASRRTLATATAEKPQRPASAMARPHTPACWARTRGRMSLTTSCQEGAGSGAAICDLMPQFGRILQDADLGDQFPGEHCLGIRRHPAGGKTSSRLRRHDDHLGVDRDDRPGAQSGEPHGPRGV